MTTSVKFFLSYDHLNMIKSPNKINIFSARKLSMTLRLRAKVLLHVCSYDFYDMRLSTE